MVAAISNVGRPPRSSIARTCDASHRGDGAVARKRSCAHRRPDVASQPRGHEHGHPTHPLPREQLSSLVRDYGGDGHERDGRRREADPCWLLVRSSRRRFRRVRAARCRAREFRCRVACQGGWSCTGEFPCASASTRDQRVRFLCGLVDVALGQRRRAMQGVAPFEPHPKRALAAPTNGHRPCCRVTACCCDRCCRCGARRRGNSSNTDGHHRADQQCQSRHNANGSTFPLMIPDHACSFLDNPLEREARRVHAESGTE